MVIQTSWVTPESDPIRVLADEVKRLKGGDTLAKVRVIVDSHETGVLTRRNLAPLFAGSDGGNGLGAVDFITFDQLAESIVRKDGSLAKRRKSNAGVIRLAAKKVLENHGEEFPGTNQKKVTINSFHSIFRSYERLKDHEKATLRRVPGRTSTLIKICDEISERIALAFYSASELRQRATEVLRAHPENLHLDPVIVFLPTHINRSGAETIHGLSGQSAVSIILRTFGDGDLDDSFTDWARRADPSLAKPSPCSYPASNLAFVDAHDPTDEVRYAIKAIIEAAKRGAKFSEMEVVYTSEEPYLPYLLAQLNRSHIPFVASPAGRLSDTAWAKRVQATLEITSSTLTLDGLFDLLKLRGDPDHEEAMPVSTMEEVARTVLGDLAETHWLNRLEGCANELLGDLKSYRFSRNFNPAQIHQACLKLIEEIKEIIELRESTKDKTLSFTEWIAWGDKFRLWQLQSDGETSTDTQFDARQSAVAEILRALKKLDLIVAVVAFEEFRDSVLNAIESEQLKIGKIDHNLPIHPIWSTPFSPRKLVIILGMTEDRVAALKGHDPLITRYLEGKYHLEGHPESTRYFEAKATLSNIIFSSEEVILTSCRSDLSDSKAKSPARWLCDLLSMSVGRRVSTSEYLFLKDPKLRHLEGDFSELLKIPLPIEERDLNILRAREISRATFNLRAFQPRDSDGPLERSLRLKSARASQNFTEFDGMIGEAIFEQIEKEAFSPTALERWATCPFSYFARDILSIDVIESPSGEARISPRDRGNIIHHALDAMVKWSLKDPNGTSSKPGSPWSEEEMAVAIASAEAKIAEFARLNRFAKPLYHGFERNRLISEIKEIVHKDGKFREDSQAETVGSEVYFGPNERLRAKLGVGGEPGVEFAGRIDRIDLRHSLNQMVVVDYKSGKSSQYKISPENPTQNGRNLQLAIYAASLSEMEQASEMTPELIGEYLFTAPSEEAKRIYLVLTDEVKERVALVVKSIVQAIWDGSFPQGLLNPSANPIGCEYCDPSNLRPRWHNQQIKAKLADRVISSFADLVYPDDVRHQDDYPDGEGD
ncbi:MAG: PD-(D/E)XK nuclease family protein [Acidimicrobiaceae bacterium]|nr:PD-(D/E)XK nuclease family protein [Acidimicrobiaceae bacterium]